MGGNGKSDIEGNGNQCCSEEEETQSGIFHWKFVSPLIETRTRRIDKEVTDKRNVEMEPFGIIKREIMAPQTPLDDRPPGSVRPFLRWLDSDKKSSEYWVVGLLA